MTADPVGPLAGATDADVIRLSRAEPERFGEIFRRWFTRIHQYLGGRVGGRIADDLAAEVFTRAFAQRERYDLTRDSAGPWLFGIAPNLAGTYWRQERSRYRALARSHQNGAAPSDEDLITDRMSAVAAGPALAALDRGERDVLLLAALAGLGNQEIAQSLGIPYGTVCSRLSRARKRCCSRWSTATAATRGLRCACSTPRRRAVACRRPAPGSPSRPRH